MDVHPHTAPPDSTEGTDSTGAVDAPEASSHKAQPMRPSRWQILQSWSGMKAVRLMTFVAVLAAIGVGVTYSRVRGQVGEQMIAMGENLMQYDRAERQDAPRELTLNGQAMMVTSGTSPDSLDTVLDDFEARCRSHNAALQQEIQTVSAQDFFVMRTVQGQVGAVGCLDFGAEISAAELLVRVSRFRQSNDLQDLGNLRYVYARTLDEGSGVHFLTFWTTGSLDFDEITGHGGATDVPGTDVTDIPRPPESRRILHAMERGADLRVVGYTGSSMTSWELEAMYREQLPRAGYRLIDDQSRRSSTDGRILLGLERDQRVTFVMLSNDRHGLGSAAIISGE